MTIGQPQWRQDQAGNWQFLANDGYWYAAPGAPTGPPIYQRPRRRKSWLRWPVRILLAVLLGLGGILAGVLIRGNGGGPSQSYVESSELQASKKEVSGVVTMSCVMPSSWAAGKTFTCYGFGSSGKQLIQMGGTVLPDSSGGQYQWEESWIPG